MSLEHLPRVLKDALCEERDEIAALSMMAAYVFAYLDRVNWAGFYRLVGGELVVGPYQGHPACVRIALGRGVCGASAQEGRTLIVPDVSAFPGYIACDAQTRSEIVLPIRRGGAVWGVLDIDSPEPARFTQREADVLEEAVAVFESLSF
jgi:GAF domain-containing protein